MTQLPSAPTIARPASDSELRTLLVRATSEKRPVWMLDSSGRFTDFRAIRHGTQVNIRGEGVHLNPLHAFKIEHLNADATALAALLRTLWPPLDVSILSGALMAFIDESRQGNVFPGAVLEDFIRYAESAPATTGEARKLRELQQAQPQVMHLLGGKTTLPKGMLMQVSYPAEAQMHAAVMLTMQRLAEITMRLRPAQALLMVSEATHHDTPQLAALTWENPRSPQVIHVRV